MRATGILLMLGVMMVNPARAAEETNTVPESCSKLVAALEACEKGPEGPFGAIRKTCEKNARKEYECNIPLHEVRRRLGK